MTAISDKYAALGGAGGFLGAATSTELTNADGVGRRQTFQNGVIYWHENVEAHEVHGAILGRWSAMGFETSGLGYPMTDEISTTDGVGRFNHFQHGSIYWDPALGAHDVQRRIRERWAQLGWEGGFLGYPIADQRTEVRGRTSVNVARFVGGRIEQDASTGEIISFHRPSTRAPNYEVRVVALRVRDTDGKRPTNITIAGVQRWLTEANVSFAIAGIRFAWDATLGELDDTDVNSVTGVNDPAWIHVRDVLDERARQERAVLIVFRHGPGLDPTGQGFSGWDINFVVMPQDTRQFGLLTHELGHQLGLSHTHLLEFQTEADAADYFLSRFGDASWFDADVRIRDPQGRPVITDTPPDPHIKSLAHETQRSSVSLAGVPFALARDNVMSYWPTPHQPHWDTPHHKTFSASQIDYMRQFLLARATRAPLDVVTITNPVRLTVRPYPVPLERPVSVLIEAVEVETGLRLTGDVVVDGHVVGSTGSRFTFTFRRRRRRLPDGEWELINPAGVVRAPGMPDEPIDFGFPS